MTKGLIKTQIGLAQKVRPQGAIRASWEAFLSEQVEMDEAREYAEENRPLSPVEIESKTWSPTIMRRVLGFLP